MEFRRQYDLTTDHNLRPTLSKGLLRATDFTMTLAVLSIHRAMERRKELVQTVKSLLKKSEDPYLALLSYRTTPLSNGYSPSELSCGRLLRSTILTTMHQLKPKILPWEDIGRKEKHQAERQKENFDNKHRAKELRKLSPEDPVFVVDRNEHGKVISAAPQPRSYYAATPTGTFRRNRTQLVNVSSLPQEDENDDEPDLPGECSERDAENEEAVNPQPVAPQRNEGAANQQPDARGLPPVRTRSGREVHPPERYRDQ